MVIDVSRAVYCTLPLDEAVLFLGNHIDGVLSPGADIDSTQIVNGDPIQIVIQGFFENRQVIGVKIQSQYRRAFAETNDQHLIAGTVVNKAIG